jgi:[ribosomal protein S5]-alanine N-acetyltransferase
VVHAQMNIFGERLTLKLIDESDLEAIHELHSRPEVDQFNTLGIPKNIKETEGIVEPWIFDNKKDDILNYTFAIVLTKPRKFIGLIALKLGSIQHKKAEVWYKLHPNYWGQGLASEALEGVLSFGFNSLKLHRIEAGAAVENIASIKLLEKVGMKREGRKRKVLPLKKGWSDNYIYAILEEDYFLQQKT